MDAMLFYWAVETLIETIWGPEPYEGEMEKID